MWLFNNFKMVLLSKHFAQKQWSSTSNSIRKFTQKLVEQQQPTLSIQVHTIHCAIVYFVNSSARTANAYSTRWCISAFRKIRSAYIRELFCAPTSFTTLSRSTIAITTTVKNAHDAHTVLNRFLLYFELPRQSIICAPFVFRPESKKNVFRKNYTCAKRMHFGFLVCFASGAPMYVVVS